jgi:hypothetical protein
VSTKKLILLEAATADDEMSVHFEALVVSCVVVLMADVAEFPFIVWQFGITLPSRGIHTDLADTYSGL